MGQASAPEARALASEADVLLPGMTAAETWRSLIDQDPSSRLARLLAVGGPRQLDDDDDDEGESDDDGDSDAGDAQEDAHDEVDQPQDRIMPLAIPIVAPILPDFVTLSTRPVFRSGEPDIYLEDLSETHSPPPLIAWDAVSSTLDAIRDVRIRASEGVPRRAVLREELNDAQRRAFDFVAANFASSPAEQLLLLVVGTAGTGKSFLIDALVHHMGKSVAVCAPTGAAADNVGGATLHSYLRLGIKALQDAPLMQLQVLLHAFVTLSLTSTAW